MRQSTSNDWQDRYDASGTVTVLGVRFVDLPVSTPGRLQCRLVAVDNDTKTDEATLMVCRPA